MRKLGKKRTLYTYGKKCHFAHGRGTLYILFLYFIKTRFCAKLKNEPTGRWGVWRTGRWDARGLIRLRNAKKHYDSLSVENFNDPTEIPSHLFNEGRQRRPVRRSVRYALVSDPKLRCRPRGPRWVEWPTLTCMSDQPTCSLLTTFNQGPNAEASSLRRSEPKDDLNLDYPSSLWNDR